MSYEPKKIPNKVWIVHKDWRTRNPYDCSTPLPREIYLTKENITKLIKNGNWRLS